MTIVNADINAGVTPFLCGEPGIGKSSFIESLAHQRSTKCFTVTCNVMADKADLTGQRLVPKGEDDEGNPLYRQVFFPNEDVMEAVEYAKTHPREKVFLFLDEINRTTSDVTSALLSAITARRIGNIHFPDNLRLVCAGNDKGNVTALDEASISRFSVYHIEPDADTFLGLHADLYPAIRRVLEQHPDLIFAKTFVEHKTDDTNQNNGNSVMYIDDIIDIDDGMSQITCPRTLKYLSDFLNNLDDSEIRMLLTTAVKVNGEDMNLLQETIQSHIGATKFAIYLCEEISDSLTRGPQTSNILKLIEPDGYRELTTVSTMTELTSAIASLDDTTRSHYLVYAIYEPKNNTDLINALAPMVTSLESEDMNNFLRLAMEHRCDEQNLEVFSQTDSLVAKQLESVINAI